MSVRVTSGRHRRVMLALHLDTGDDPLPAPPGAVEVHERPDGVAVVLPAATLNVRSGTAVTIGDDGPLFDDGRSRCSSVVTLSTEPGPGLDVELTVDPRGRDRAGCSRPRVPGRSRRSPATGGQRSRRCASAPWPRPSRSP